MAQTISRRGHKSQN